MKASGASSSRLSMAAVNSAAMSSTGRSCRKIRIASDNRQRATTSLETEWPAASASAAATCLATRTDGLISFSSDTAVMPACGAAEMAVEGGADEAHQGTSFLGHVEPPVVFSDQ